jgi:hypothetical protein
VTLIIAPQAVELALRAVGFHPRLVPTHCLQLTGRNIDIGATHHDPGEIADPSPPVTTREGKVQIYGTASYFLEYESWEHLLQGGEPQRHRITLCHPDGTPSQGEQANWDMLKHEWLGKDGEVIEVLYAGTMTPPPGKAKAHWPQDNWGRRIYAFRKDENKWVRDQDPLFEKVPSEPTWIGHQYGHHFIIDDSGVTWIFYESVTEERELPTGEYVPFRTELFARRMTSPFSASPDAVKVLSLGEKPFPSTLRVHHATGQHNGYLIEGGRPTKVNIQGEDFYMLSFSSGDFPTDRYSMNMAYSRTIEGPYTPLVNADGKDLTDFGLDLKQRLGLSWGPARAVIFADPTGGWWTMFHAVQKHLLPDRDYSNWPREPLRHFHRSLFLAPVRFELGADGMPEVRVLF